MSRYHRTIARNAEGQSDVYDVLRAFNVTDPAVAHAIKKLLAPGQRAGGKSAAQDLEEAKWSVDCAIKALPGASGEGNMRHWDDQLKGMVDKAAEEVKESFKAIGRAPTWHTKGYQEAVERAREAHFAILRGNGIDTPVADCNDPKAEVDGVDRWAAKREAERGAPPADDPRPRAETIVVADKYVTPMRDDPGAGVFFKRRWWWPF